MLKRDIISKMYKKVLNTKIDIYFKVSTVP